jgi:hypothetical protein
LLLAVDPAGQDQEEELPGLQDEVHVGTATVGIREHRQSGETAAYTPAQRAPVLVPRVANQICPSSEEERVYHVHLQFPQPCLYLITQ